MNEPSNERCQAAVLTPSGRGAVATIRLIGTAQRVERSGFLPARRKPLSKQPVRDLWFGFWGEAPAEEVVLARLADCEWELHCHGGHAAVNRILQALRDLGWETRGWKELLAESEPFPCTEHREAVSLAATWKTTELLLKHSAEQFIADLNALITAVSTSGWNDENSRSWAAHWKQMLAWNSFGLHLTVPFRVILAGAPNVGKSSLLNRLAGFQRAIVHDRPGTTRDVVRTLCAFDGWPFELSDTAGIRSDSEHLESLGIEKSRAEIAQADLVLFLTDVSSPPAASEEDCLQNCPHVLRIGHKADLPTHANRVIEDETILVSSVNGSGIDQLISEIVNRLVPETPPASELIPISLRQINLLNQLQSACDRNDSTAIRACCERLLKPDTVRDESAVL